MYMYIGMVVKFKYRPKKVKKLGPTIQIFLICINNDYYSILKISYNFKYLKYLSARSI